MWPSPIRKGSPVICITLGDPRGIGPEVIKKAIFDPAVKNKAYFLIVGEPDVKKNDADYCAKSALRAINTAFTLILNKKADAMVTAPVNKEAINKAGIKIEGHTEYLAGLCGCRRFAMMFVSRPLKVSLVTRHIPLSRVSASISIKSVCDTAELTHELMKKRFNLKNPRIGIAGLNPHCGEGGIFGKEERLVIRPAVKKLKKIFKGISGPVPGDVLLHDAYRGKFDAAVCMYHDQALCAFKMIARDKGVNLTLGLPFIRTSPDHGTGFDIAGKGIADAGSMVEAIRLAIRLTKRAYNYAN